MSAFSGYGATKAQVEELFTIFSVMRPHGSDMEAKFIDHFLGPLKPDVDKAGNLIVRVGKAPVMWSSHVDTVHNYGGIAPLKLDDKGLITIHPKSRANCLGADDGAGVWLMLQMIRAKRPGMYVFHRGEERGCIGSRFIAKTTPKLLDGIEAAIAFDRKDTGSIITHQMGSRCCSEDFSTSIAEAIGLGMKSDTTGSVTDTAQYTDLVGECTNISVGYKWQHGRTEEQDLIFLLTLRDRMLEVDVKDLVYKRKAGEVEKKTYGGKWAGANYGGYGGYAGIDDDWSSAHWDDPKLKWKSGKIWSALEKGYVYPESSGRVWDASKEKWVMADNKEKGVRNYMDHNNRWLVARRVGDKIVADTHLTLTKDFPDQIAAILADKGYGIAYLHEQIKKKGGKFETAYLPAEGKKDDKDEKKSNGDWVCKGCSRLKRFCACH